jgi:predicted nucleotide-binding protein (sugar kinase/HSP70/actin superfamily)
MDVPDNEALRVGKEVGNRGQCNPTYFTVGNLIKKLQQLEAGGLTKREIIDRYIFVNAGACGPCRFGMYTTEYRRALRESGFEGFRVMLFQQQGGIQQATGDAPGFEVNTLFFRSLLTTFILGDLLNLMGYRIRPYEVEAGATDRAIEECRQILIEALENRRSVWRALRRCKKVFAGVRVDRLQAKPKVAIIGEFWAMTTEGEGNYELQRFLESEGAEVIIQPMVNWILFIFWEQITDTQNRMRLRGADKARKGLAGKNPWKKILLLKLARMAWKTWFKSYAWAIGLVDHHLPDMDQIAALAHQHYDNEVRGGEGHMEVGKVIHYVQDQEAHMVVSVKPFGCMPSSGVSDGVQSLVQSRFPQAIFVPIETSGDGRVNVESRVQMMLFRAHQRARDEFDDAVESSGRSLDELRNKQRPQHRSPFYNPPHHKAGTGSNLVRALIDG